MEAIETFENALFGQIRTSVTESGEPLFCLADICNALDLGGGARNVKSRLSPEGVVSINTLTNGGAQQLNFINEPNLYRCIFQSRKKGAEQFQNWVYTEVLPSIRKKGGYISAAETPEETMARAILLAQETIERQRRLIEEKSERVEFLEEERDGLAKLVDAGEAAIREMTPKAVFADALVTSDKSILIGELAKILKQNGVETGQKRLFRYLRENGFLCTKGEAYNQPSQKSLEMGLMELKKTIVMKPSGDSIVTTTPKVTAKGQSYFVNRFLSASRTSSTAPQRGHLNL